MRAASSSESLARRNASATSSSLLAATRRGRSRSTMGSSAGDDAGCDWMSGGCVLRGLIVGSTRKMRMASLPRPVPVPVRLDLDPHFRPCEPLEGEELYPNGIFEFNVTRLLAYIGTAGRFRAEPVSLDDIPYAGKSEMLNELAVVAADLTRPVVLAEIAPGRYNLI